MFHPVAIQSKQNGFHRDGNLIFFMLSAFFFHWYRLQSRYAEALACRRATESILDYHDVFSLNRLGLYETVANSVCDLGDWRCDIPRLVSLAACGRLDEASRLAHALNANSHLSPHRVRLAEALAPFAPALALKFAESVANAPLLLLIALLLKAGRHIDASLLIERSIDSGLYRSQPEIFLFKSNSVNGSSAQKLSFLNAFLAAYKLTPVALVDPSCAPCPTNLCSDHPLRTQYGPLVSVLMTAFRSGTRISPAIHSLLNQTYQNLEIIVVDDASDDNTGDVVQALADQDRRVRYIRLPRNVGTYVAKNIGLRHAHGEFVTCHDSDDWSHPLRIERQVRPLLKNPFLVFTTSHWVRQEDDGIYYARQVQPLLRLNPASPLFRRQLVLDRAGAWDPVRTGADSEFLARLKLVFGPLAMRRIAQPLAFGSHRPNSLMTAVDTGYCPQGMSPTRLAYWENWGHWHINELRQKRRPFIPTDLLAERRFAAPESILVPRADIEACLAAVG